MRAMRRASNPRLKANGVGSHYPASPDLTMDAAPDQIAPGLNPHQSDRNSKRFHPLPSSAYAFLRPGDRSRFGQRHPGRRDIEGRGARIACRTRVRTHSLPGLYSRQALRQLTGPKQGARRRPQEGFRLWGRPLLLPRKQPPEVRAGECLPCPERSAARLQLRSGQKPEPHRWRQPPATAEAEKHLAPMRRGCRARLRLRQGQQPFCAPPG